jgi:hypothetical protein
MTMINKILGLMTILLLLSACSFIAPATPSTSQLETLVFQTLTAMPSPLPPTNTPVVVRPTNTMLAPAPTVSLPTPTVSLPTPTMVLPTPTAVPTNIPIPTSVSYPTQVVQQPPAVTVYSPRYADQFIYYYFYYINQRNYPRTWSLLTDSFKYTNNTAAQGGYLGYANFWDSVRRVDIFGVTVTSLSGNYAVVNVNMRYTYQNGAVVSNLQTYNLIYDPGRGSWLFNSFTAITTPSPEPAIVQTPEQFIYSYFSNINAGNYSLTWTLLTDRFKAIANNSSYTNYTNFWSSVTRVDVGSVSLSSQNGGTAVVNVYMVFNYSSGVVTPNNLVFHLVYDWSRATWLFDSPN